MNERPHTCPSCQGEGSSLCFVNRGPTAAHTAEARECRRCLGAGRITSRQLENYNHGKAMREARLARGETLRDAATRLGVPVVELSAREHGLLP